jgi:hypothetical protein
MMPAHPIADMPPQANTPLVRNVHGIGDKTGDSVLAPHAGDHPSRCESEANDSCEKFALCG